MKIRTKLLSALLSVLLLLPAFPFTAGAVDTVDINVCVPDAAVASGQTFTAEVRFADPSQLGSRVVAGLQVEIGFDTGKLSTSKAAVVVDPSFAEECGSFSGKGVTAGGKVIFVAIRDGFSASTGFSSSLTGIFSVTFTAKTDVANVYDLFSASAISAVLGDSSAVEVDGTIKAVKAAAGSLADLATGSLGYTANASIGGKAVGDVLTGVGNDTTLSALKSQFGTNPSQEIKVKTAGGEYLSSSDVVKTGMTVELYENGSLVESAVVIVKGDGDCSGACDVFDAVIVLSWIVDPEKNPLSPAALLALDADGSNGNDVFDAVAILTFIVKGSWS